MQHHLDGARGTEDETALTEHFHNRLDSGLAIVKSRRDRESKGRVREGFEKRSENGLRAGIVVSNKKQLHSRLPDGNPGPFPGRRGSLLVSLSSDVQSIVAYRATDSFEAVLHFVARLEPTKPTEFLPGMDSGDKIATSPSTGLPSSANPKRFWMAWRLASIEHGTE